MSIVDAINNNAPLMTALAAMVQTAFTVALVAVYVRRQTRIMERQNEINQKIDESNVLRDMRREYEDVCNTHRGLFIEHIRDKYRSFQAERGIEDRVDHLIQDTGFPFHINISETSGSLYYWIEAHVDSLADNLLWQFAKHVYPDLTECITCRPELDEARQQLASFWSRWAMVSSSLEILDIRVYLPPAYNDIVILSWLEIAKVQQTRDTGHWEAGLLELAFTLTRAMEDQADASLGLRPTGGI